MLQAKELRVGLFVWWNAGRYMSGWSCPCIVTTINRKKGFRVRSLDNFRETDWLRLKDIPDLDRSSLHEMRECSREEIEQYFETTTQGLRNEVTTIKGRLVAAQRRLAAYKKQVDEFLTQSATS